MLVACIAHAGSANFQDLHDRLLRNLGAGRPISKEAWSKLFELMEVEEDAEAAIELLLEDAAVREAEEWDWGTHGYGQSLFHLVQVKAVGAGCRKVVILFYAPPVRLHLLSRWYVSNNLYRRVQLPRSPSLQDFHWYFSYCGVCAGRGALRALRCSG